MINQSTSSMPLSPRVIKATFDMCTEGCKSFWEAHSFIVDEAGIDPAEIWNVEYKGDAPNGWPMLEVTFQSMEVAKLYTCVYLGLGPIVNAWDVYIDEEVNEYLSAAEYVLA